MNRQPIGYYDSVDGPPYGTTRQRFASQSAVTASAGGIPAVVDGNNMKMIPPPEQQFVWTVPSTVNVRLHEPAEGPTTDDVWPQRRPVFQPAETGTWDSDPYRGIVHRHPNAGHLFHPSNSFMYHPYGGGGGGGGWTGRGFSRL